MSYEDEKKAANQEFKNHEAYPNAYWNADGDEIRELCNTWDAIKAYGVPKELLEKLFECGYTAGANNEADNQEDW